jgi:hypothetical protein
MSRVLLIVRWLSDCRDAGSTGSRHQALATVEPLFLPYVHGGFARSTQGTVATQGYVWVRKRWVAAEWQVELNNHRLPAGGFG